MKTTWIWVIFWVVHSYLIMYALASCQIHKLNHTDHFTGQVTFKTSLHCGKVTTVIMKIQTWLLECGWRKLKLVQSRNYSRHYKITFFFNYHNMRITTNTSYRTSFHTLFLANLCMFTLLTNKQTRQIYMYKLGNFDYSLLCLVVLVLTCGIFLVLKLCSQASIFPLKL